MAHETEGRQQEGKEEVASLLAPYRAFVSYVPLKTEVPFRDYIDIPSDTTVYEIAPRASLDPEEEARKAIATVGETAVALLIPGRAFDRSGTRHGRGGGWYDRFLTYVPDTWLRVGFCYEKQFSETPLVRESWDQAMDRVVVVNGEGVRVYEGKRV